MIQSFAMNRRSKTKVTVGVWEDLTKTAQCVLRNLLVILCVICTDLTIDCLLVERGIEAGYA